MVFYYFEGVYCGDQEQEILSFPVDFQLFPKSVRVCSITLNIDKLYHMSSAL